MSKYRLQAFLFTISLVFTSAVGADDFYVLNYEELLVDSALTADEFQVIQHLQEADLDIGDRGQIRYLLIPKSRLVQFSESRVASRELNKASQAGGTALDSLTDTTTVWCVCENPEWYPGVFVLEMNPTEEDLIILARLVRGGVLGERVVGDGRVLGGADLERLSRLLWWNDSATPPGWGGEAVAELAALLERLNIEWLLDLEADEGLVVLTGLRTSEEITIYSWLRGIAASSAFFRVHHDRRSPIDEVIQMLDRSHVPVSMRFDLGGFKLDDPKRFLKLFDVYVESKNSRLDIDSTRVHLDQKGRPWVSGTLPIEGLDLDAAVVVESRVPNIWLVGSVDQPLARRQEFPIPDRPWTRVSTSGEFGLTVGLVSLVDGVEARDPWGFKVLVEDLEFERAPSEVLDRLDERNRSRFRENPLEFLERVGSEEGRRILGIKAGRQRKFARNVQVLSSRLAAVCQVAEILQSVTGKPLRVVVSAKHSGGWLGQRGDRQREILEYAPSILRDCLEGGNAKIDLHLDVEEDHHARQYLYILLSPTTGSGLFGSAD